MAITVTEKAASEVKRIIDEHHGTVTIENSLERTRVDDKKEVILLDNGAVLELDLIEKAGDARTHLDDVDGIEPAGVLIPLHNLFFERVRYRDGWGRRGRRPLNLVLGASCEDENRKARNGRANRRAG